MEFKKNDTLAILPAMFCNDTMANIINPKRIILKPKSTQQLDLLMDLSVNNSTEINILTPLFPKSNSFKFLHKSFTVDNTTPCSLMLINPSDKPIILYRGQFLCNFWISSFKKPIGNHQKKIKMLFDTPG